MCANLAHVKNGCMIAQVWLIRGDSTSSSEHTSTSDNATYARNSGYGPVSHSSPCLVPGTRWYSSTWYIGTAVSLCRLHTSYQYSILVGQSNVLVRMIRTDIRYST